MKRYIDTKEYCLTRLAEAGHELTSAQEATIGTTADDKSLIPSDKCRLIASYLGLEFNYTWELLHSKVDTTTYN